MSLHKCCILVYHYIKINERIKTKGEIEMTASYANYTITEHMGKKLLEIQKCDIPTRFNTESLVQRKVGLIPVKTFEYEYGTVYELVTMQEAMNRRTSN